MGPKRERRHEGLWLAALGPYLWIEHRLQAGLWTGAVQCGAAHGPAWADHLPAAALLAGKHRVYIWVIRNRQQRHPRRVKGEDGDEARPRSAADPMPGTGSLCFHGKVFPSAANPAHGPFPAVQYPPAHPPQPCAISPIHTTILHV